jgi:hypothetical protein
MGGIMRRPRPTGVSPLRAITVIAFIACLASAACHRGPILPLAPLDTASRDPTQDHVKMASIYVRQAMRSRELAEEQSNRAFVYERVFGAGSDWVSSARLLAQFYENSARDQERQANWHLEMAGQRTPQDRP